MPQTDGRQTNFDIMNSADTVNNGQAELKLRISELYPNMIRQTRFREVMEASAIQVMYMHYYYQDSGSSSSSQ